METGKLENASLEIVCKQLVVNTRDQFCKNSGREEFGSGLETDSLTGAHERTMRIYLLLKRCTRVISQFYLLLLFVSISLTYVK